jgi:hypothetical protein
MEIKLECTEHGIGPSVDLIIKSRQLIEGDVALCFVDGTEWHVYAYDLLRALRPFVDREQRMLELNAIKMGRK